MKRPSSPLLLVNLTALIIGVSYGLHGPVLPIFAKNVAGATYTELGLVGVANFFPYLMIPLLVGILLDRFNGGHLLAVGVVINSASVCLLSVVQSVPEIVALRIMSGVAHAFFWPPCESIISDHSREGERVRNISGFAIFFVAGFMAGPLVGAALLDGLGASYGMLFQLTALVMAAALVSSAMLSRSHRQRPHRRFAASSLLEIVRFPVVIVVLVFCTAAFGIMLTIYPAHLSDKGISDAEILVLYFVFGIARVGSLAMAGRLASRAGAVLSLAMAGVAAGFAVSAFADGPGGFAVALVLMGFGLSIFFPLTLEVVLSRTGSRSVGKIIGAYETLFGVGWMVGPAIGGPATQAFGNEALYVAFCIAGAGVAALAAAFRGGLEPYGRGGRRSGAR